MLFMIQTSNIQIAIADKTIICLQFPLINRTGKEARGKGIHKIHAKAAPEKWSCFSPKLYAHRRARHTGISICQTETSSPSNLISSVAVSAMGQKKRKNLMDLRPPEQQLIMVCYFASLADG